MSSFEKSDIFESSEVLTVGPLYIETERRAEAPQRKNPRRLKCKTFDALVYEAADIMSEVNESDGDCEGLGFVIKPSQVEVMAAALCGDTAKNTVPPEFMGIPVTIVPEDADDEPEPQPTPIQVSGGDADDMVEEMSMVKDQPGGIVWYLRDSQLVALYRAGYVDNAGCVLGWPALAGDECDEHEQAAQRERDEAERLAEEKKARRAKIARATQSLADKAFRQFVDQQVSAAFGIKPFTPREAAAKLVITSADIPYVPSTGNFKTRTSEFDQCKIDELKAGEPTKESNREAGIKAFAAAMTLPSMGFSKLLGEHLQRGRKAQNDRIIFDPQSWVNNGYLPEKEASPNGSIKHPIFGYSDLESESMSAFRGGRPGLPTPKYFIGFDVSGLRDDQLQWLGFVGSRILERGHYMLEPFDMEGRFLLEALTRLKVLNHDGLGFFTPRDKK